MLKVELVQSGKVLTVETNSEPSIEFLLSPYDFSLFDESSLVHPLFALLTCFPLEATESECELFDILTDCELFDKESATLFDKVSGALLIVSFSSCAKIALNCSRTGSAAVAEKEAALSPCKLALSPCE